VPYYLIVFVFALCERKKKNKIIGKYHAAVRPEFTEGQAKNHSQAVIA
jgi:hypothetical protein